MLQAKELPETSVRESLTAGSCPYRRLGTFSFSDSTCCPGMIFRQLRRPYGYNMAPSLKVCICSGLGQVLNACPKRSGLLAEAKRLAALLEAPGSRRRSPTSRLSPEDFIPLPFQATVLQSPPSSLSLRAGARPFARQSQGPSRLCSGSSQRRCRRRECLPSLRTLGLAFRVFGRVLRV